MADSKATLRIAAVGCLAAAGAVVLALTGGPEPSGRPAPEGAPQAAPVAASAVQGAAAPGTPDPAVQTASVHTDPAQTGAVEPAPAAEAPETAPAPTPATPPSEAPRFDVVRVEPDGAALVAGRAAPGATVEARLDGRTVASGTADASGQFVLFAETAPGPRAQELTLAARLPDRAETVSTDSVLILPSAAGRPAVGAEAPPPPDAPGAAADAPDRPEAAPPPPGEPAQAAAAAAPPAADAALDTSTADAALDTSTADVASDAAAAAPVLLRTSSTGAVSVLEPAALGPARGVTLDALTYTATGDVHLSGRGRAGRTARIYADDRRQADAAIDGQGAWTATLASLSEPGRYTLRIDEIDETGRVASRIESPFLREPPETLAALPHQVVVQPGHSLWAIAQARYGSGTRYALVYGANRERIRDPDLIYPGQVFDLPSGEAPPPR